MRIINNKHSVLFCHEIKDDTVTVALDMSGGMSDRVMLGRKGILLNANASLECWNLGYIEGEEEYTKPFEITDSISDEDLRHAIDILETDNFTVMVVLNQPIIVDNLIIGRDIIVVEPLGEKQVIVDVDKIDFKNNMYPIY